MAELSPMLEQATGLNVTHGSGTTLVDDQGRSYLDFTAGIGVVSTGHCHPRVVEALQNQAAQLIHGQQQTVYHPQLRALLDELTQVLPARLDSAFLTTTGSEAVEAAVKLARHSTARTNLISFQGGFHGRTMGSLSLTSSKTAIRAGVQPTMGGVFISPFPYAYRYGWDEEATVDFCLQELDFLLASQSAPAETAAMIIEPVLGEGGFVPVPPRFLEGLRQRCDDDGILLIVDEVQAGIGRTGCFWGYQHAKIVPDVLVMAKGLASGMPLSGIAAPTGLMQGAWPGSQGGTYAANVLSCAAAVATLQVIRDDGLVERSAEAGELLKRQLVELQGTHPDQIGDVRGRGLMCAVELKDQASVSAGELNSAVRKICLDHGLLLLPCGTHGQTIRWLPPLVVTDEELDRAVAIFSESLDKAA